MANTNEYFVGNGKIYIRRLDSTLAPEEGWREVGDANELSISISQDFGNHYESRSGNRVRAARWLNSTESSFTLSVQNLSIPNLVDLLQGTDSGSVASGNVVDESVPNGYFGAWVFTEHPGISNVTVEDGATALTEGTDYELDARNGGIKILEGSPNITSSEPITLTVSYDHVGIAGAVEALTNNVSDYEVRFNGINLTQPNVPVIVQMHRAQFNATEELPLIGQDITSLSFTGALLPDDNNQQFNVVKANEFNG